MVLKGKWIQEPVLLGDVCPVFRKSWTCREMPEKAVLRITALGVYEAYLNGQRVGEDVLMPGWTVYEKRLQVQEYDITSLLQEENRLEVTVGKGWFSSPMPGWMETDDKARRAARPRALLAEISMRSADGEAVIGTDESWSCAEGPVRFSEIYDGETYDARICPDDWKPAALLDWPAEILIPQEGEPVREMERIAVREILHTPAGETVLDFGQEVTGYIEFTVNAHEGDRIRLLHGEVLDQKGNFYNANYRSAKAEILYICRKGEQTWHPRLTFFGFRYIKLAEFPGEASPEQFTAVAVYSDIHKTGTLECGLPEVNQLFSNIFWGQKGNFLDVPTDCPQRDERLGWTGDAQAFVKTAAYNFDVERFFRKWLHDLKAAQRPDGGVGMVIPDYLPEGAPSAAWGDVACIAPWQIYMTYGDPQILRDQYESMKGWTDYITGATADPGLWTGGTHFGDWLGLDAPQGSYKGASREDFIATAFYYWSSVLTVKAGKVLGEDCSKYEELGKTIRAAFLKAFPEYITQTEKVLAVQFGLSEDPQKTADQLAEQIISDGRRIKTGFVGTPYILHVLSDYGHEELAWDLFLRKEYPSWLYPVEKGATTIWEHWDGIMENGEFWSTDMNSFNHYAYGAVADWIYEKAAGIQPVEEAPGFSRVVIAPKPNSRMGWLDVSLETRHGRIRSSWTCTDQGIRYEIETPVEAHIVIGEKRIAVSPGKYTYWK